MDLVGMNEPKSYQGERCIFFLYYDLMLAVISMFHFTGWCVKAHPEICFHSVLKNHLIPLGI